MRAQEVYINSSLLGVQIGFGPKGHLSPLRVRRGDKACPERSEREERFYLPSPFLAEPVLSEAEGKWARGMVSS